MSDDNDARKLVEGSARSGSGNVDVIPYFGRVKIIYGLVGASSLVVLIFAIWVNPEFYGKQLGYYGRGYVWGVEESWARAYELCITDEVSSWGCTSYTTPLEFLISTASDDPGRYVMHLLALVTLFGPLIAFLTWRRPAPIRFNSGLNAFYTWRKGLLIHPGARFKYQVPRMMDFLSMSMERGPARISMQRAGNSGKIEIVQVGPYMSALPNQPSRLLEQMKTFLSVGDSPRLAAARPNRLSYPLWHRSLLGAKKLPADIDAQAEAWLRQHGHISG